MTNHQKFLLTYVAELMAVETKLLSSIEPLAAHLLIDTAHGEAIIEASQKLREAITAALADVRITIAG